MTIICRGDRNIARDKIRSCIDTQCVLLDAASDFEGLILQEVLISACIQTLVLTKGIFLQTKC